MDFRFYGVCLMLVVLLGFAKLSAATAEDSAALPPLTSAPPKGAIVLFDGTNQDAWLSQANKKWEEADGPADWTITQDGALEVVPNAGSLISCDKFGDFKLHFEFRLPEGDVNGGVFLLARYEFGIKAKTGEVEGSQCGVFENLKQPVRPAAKVLSKPGEWQVVDIDFRAPRFDTNGTLTAKARATAHLNGVLIHDDVKLGDRKGAAKRLGDSPDGPIMLQDHGEAYQFRNVWIVKQPAVQAAARPSGDSP
jgi:hypothetical protein